MGSGSGVQGLGFGVAEGASGASFVEFWTMSFRPRVSGSDIWAPDSGFCISGSNVPRLLLSGFESQDAVFGSQGLGFWIQDLGVGIRVS